MGRVQEELRHAWATVQEQEHRVGQVGGLDEHALLYAADLESDAFGNAAGYRLPAIVAQRGGAARAFDTENTGANGKKCGNPCYAAHQKAPTQVVDVMAPSRAHLDSPLMAIRAPAKGYSEIVGDTPFRFPNLGFFVGAIAAEVVASGTVWDDLPGQKETSLFVRPVFSTE